MGGGRGKGGGKGDRKPYRARRDTDDPMERTDELDQVFQSTPAKTATNATCFVVCLMLYIQRIIYPVDHLLHANEQFKRFSKYMSWLLRHCPGLWHDHLSLSLHELMSFNRFRNHMQQCYNFILGDENKIFGNLDTNEVRAECKRHNVSVDSLRWFIPFVTVVWHNDKGRIGFTILNTDLARPPLATSFCTPQMNADQILESLRHDGKYKANYVFVRMQSGHDTLEESQRPGRQYDFRHDILIHKTTGRNWEKMKTRGDRFLKCMGRDIHLVPMQYLWSEANMLRNYGEKVLIFNLHNEETRKALQSARETENGYVCVSENISLDRLEAVFDLQQNAWVNFYQPVTETRHHGEQGLEHLLHLLHYYSEVEHHQRRNFSQLPPLQRHLLLELGENFEKYHRHPTGDIQEDATAGTTAQSSRIRTEAEDIVLEDVFTKVKGVKEKKAEKAKIQAKQMPKTKPPPDLPFKPPPAKIREQQARLAEQLRNRPSAAKPNTDTTVKLEAKQPAHPPPAKEKAADTTASSSAPVKAPPVKPPPAHLTPDTTGTVKVKPELPPAPTRPAPSAPSRAKAMAPPPIPTPPKAPDRSRTPRPLKINKMPTPPPYAPTEEQRQANAPKSPPQAPPATGRTPRPPAPPTPRSNFPDHLPTPPPPPVHSRARASSDTTDHTAKASSDTPDRRSPLPRRRPDDVDDEEFAPMFEFDLTDDADFVYFLEVLEDLENALPDPEQEKRRRRELWNQVVHLAYNGISTGSRALDRCIILGAESVNCSSEVYDIDYVPTPEEHLLRQDPGEQCRIMRPRLMLSISEEEFNARGNDIMLDLMDLGRNVLAGQAVRRDHPMQLNPEAHNSSTHYLTVVVLNLGNIERMPWFANRKRFQHIFATTEISCGTTLCFPILFLIILGTL